MAVIGIDLGTTNSLAGVWQDGKVVLIPNAFGEYLTPSVVSIGKNQEVFVGSVAKEMLATQPYDTFREFKRNMGTNFLYGNGRKKYRAEELSAFVLRRLKEDAENSKQAKKDLKDTLADISHQLKTPITSILIILDNIIDNPDMDKNTREDFIRDIKRELLNMNFLALNLLKLSKLDSNTVHFIKKEVSLDEIVTSSIKNVSPLCDLKNITIIKNLEPGIKINCDLNWQVEAITNILKNCVEHSKENSKIDITTATNKVYHSIKIRDYGTGISKKDLPHIFERFYKGESSSSNSIGIGLSLAQKIIESNDGLINVETGPDGTTFIIKYLI